MSEVIEGKNHIVTISEQEARDYIAHKLKQTEFDLEWYTKGYFSKVCRVSPKNSAPLIVKFGNSAKGYKKDKFAAEHFSSTQVHIPTVHEIDQPKNGGWACITDYAKGILSSELSNKQAENAVNSVQKTLIAIHQKDLENITGWGDLDENGKTSHNSLQDYLAYDYCPDNFYADRRIDKKLIYESWLAVKQLSLYCPNERHLVHNDFGSDNLLIEEGAVTAVLDWDFALIGDWVMDVARCQKYPLPIYGDMLQAHEDASFNSSNMA